MISKKEREKAIRGEVDATKRGGYSNYLYVNVDELNNLGIEQFKCADGDNFLCIISPPNDPFIGKKVFIHYSVGVDNTVYLCAKKMYNKPCPICEAAYKLMKVDKDDEQITELQSTMRYLFFVVDMSSKKTIKKGVQWYDAPKRVKDGICSVSENKRTKAVIDVSDPDEGKNVCFVKTGSRLRTRYDGFELEDREDKFQEEWLDIPDFDKVLQKVDYDIIKADHLGYAPEKDDEEKEDEQPRGRRGAVEKEDEDKPRGRKSVEEDDKGEEEQPRRGGRSAPDDTDAKGEEGGDESLRGRLRRRLKKETEED